MDSRIDLVDYSKNKFLLWGQREWQLNRLNPGRGCEKLEYGVRW